MIKAIVRDFGRCMLCRVSRQQSLLCFKRNGAWIAMPEKNERLPTYNLVTKFWLPKCKPRRNRAERWNDGFHAIAIGKETVPHFRPRAVSLKEALEPASRKILLCRLVM